MAYLTLRRHPSKKQRAAKAAGTAASAVGTFVKARVAWALGKRAAKVAAPAVAMGTVAVVAKRTGRFDRHHDTGQEEAAAPVDAVPTRTIA